MNKAKILLLIFVLLFIPVISEAETITDSNILEINPTNDSIIKVEQRNITVLFDKEYELSMLLENLNFYDSSLNQPIGGIFIRKDKDVPQKVIISFARLEPDKEYFFSVNGSVYSKYTTKSSDLVSENFSEWNTESFNTILPNNTYFKAGDLTFGYIENSLKTSSYTISENKDGSNYISVKNTEMNKNNSIGYILPQKFYSGRLIVELGIRGGNTEGEFQKSALDIGGFFSDTPGKGTVKATNTIRIHKLSLFTDDENGFKNIRIIYDKTPYDNGSTVEMTLIDMKNTENKVALSFPFTASEEENYISSISFAKLYSHMDANDTADLSFVRVYYPQTIEIVNSLEEFSPENRFLELTFSDNISEASLMDNSITLTGNNKRVNMKFASYSDRKAVFALQEHLNYSQNYEISLKDIYPDTAREASMSETTAFTTAAIPIKRISDSIQNEGGTVTAMLTLGNTSSKTRKFMAALLLYDENGAIAHFKAEESEILPTEYEKNVTVSIPNAQYSTYEIIVWDTTGRYIPVK